MFSNNIVLISDIWVMHQVNYLINSKRVKFVAIYIIIYQLVLKYVYILV